MSNFNNIAKLAEKNEKKVVQAIENWTRLDTGISKRVIFNHINMIARHILINKHSYKRSEAVLTAFDYGLNLLERLIAREYLVTLDDAQFERYIQIDLEKFLVSDDYALLAT